METITVQLAFENRYTLADLGLETSDGLRVVHEIQLTEDGQYIIRYGSRGGPRDLLVQPAFLLSIDDEEDDIYE